MVLRVDQSWCADSRVGRIRPSSTSGDFGLMASRRALTHFAYPVTRAGRRLLSTPVLAVHSPSKASHRFEGDPAARMSATSKRPFPPAPACVNVGSRQHPQQRLVRIQGTDLTRRSLDPESMGTGAVWLLLVSHVR